MILLTYSTLKSNEIISFSFLPKFCWCLKCFVCQHWYCDIHCMLNRNTLTVSLILENLNEIISSDCTFSEPSYWSSMRTVYLVLYICVSFWLLAHESRDLSQAEKISLVKRWTNSQNYNYIFSPNDDFFQTWLFTLHCLSQCAFGLKKK